MKIIYLLPPSEGKNAWWDVWKEKLSFLFKKPLEIAVNVSEKDLKCKGKRYEEGIRLNTSLLNSLWQASTSKLPLRSGSHLSWEEREAAVSSSPQGEELRWGKIELLPAISRYSWVMYNAINYEWMSVSGKKYFEDNFFILSGMYWLVRPLDIIWNYKLPIETKGLYEYWGNTITQALDDVQADYIVDMLPLSYAKVIDWKNLKTSVIKINFLHNKDWELKKITHGVKKVKGEYIKNICEQGFTDITKRDSISWEIDIISQ